MNRWPFDRAPEPVLSLRRGAPLWVTPADGRPSPYCRGWYNVKAVKEKIHPKWFPEAHVHCACGSTFTTGSTLKDISVEICSACHPLFTGTQKFVDTAGRVDKFEKKYKQQRADKAASLAAK